MDTVLTLVVLINAFLFWRIFVKMWKAGFKKKEYADGSYYARFGFIMFMNVIFAVIIGAGWVIHLLVQATL